MPMLLGHVCDLLLELVELVMEREFVHGTVSMFQGEPCACDYPRQLRVRIHEVGSRRVVLMQPISKEDADDARDASMLRNRETRLPSESSPQLHEADFYWGRAPSRYEHEC